MSLPRSVDHEGVTSPLTAPAGVATYPGVGEVVREVFQRGSTSGDMLHEEALHVQPCVCQIDHHLDRTDVRLAPT